MFQLILKGIPSVKSKVVVNVTSSRPTSHCKIQKEKRKGEKKVNEELLLNSK